jgi:uncharacterized protein YkwD
MTESFNQKLRNFFIPSLQNQLRPYSLRYSTLAFVIAFSVIMEILFFAYVDVAFRQNSMLGNIITSIQTTVADNFPNVVIQQVNAQRINNGETPLAINGELMLAAKLKAEDMAKKGYFSHQGPDGSMAWNWMDKVGYNYSYAGENLAINFFDAQDVVDAWMQSPSHRENILNKDFAEVGVAAVNGVYNGSKTVFLVQIFGTQNVPDQNKTTYASVSIKNAVATTNKTAPTNTNWVGISGGEKSSSSPANKLAVSTSSSKTLAILSSSSTGTSTRKLGLVGSAKNISALTQYMVSPRHLVSDMFAILAVYIFLVLIIPMCIIFRNHRSSSYWMRVREIFMLFRSSLWSSFVSLSCLGFILVLNYYWTKYGTEVFNASIGRGVNSFVRTLN